MSTKVFSLRMRAAEGGSHSQGGKHISGAERIITEQEIDDQISSLIKRARLHSQGEADYINLNLELLDATKIKELPMLPVTTIKTNNYLAGRKKAQKLLLKLGIDQEIITKALHLLATGANPEKNNMRGAMLIDLTTGRRLELDRYRGVRVSRMDYKSEIKDKLVRLLQSNNLNQTHLPEALVLATKVVSHSQIVAELCWSDDLDYTAGYVASRELGYCRFPKLKEMGSNLGGRVFFLKSSTDLEKVITYLEKTPVLIDQLNNVMKRCNSIKELLITRGEVNERMG